MAAATDIVVRRCTVRVVRHGGWSWGSQPQRLVDQVIAALPGLINARLADLAPEGASEGVIAEQLAGLALDGASEDVEITEPVRIVVSLTLADLLADRFDPIHHAVISRNAEPVSFPASSQEPSPGPQPRSSLGSRPGSSRHSQPEATPTPGRPHETQALDYTPSSAPPFSQPVTLVEFLTGLFDSGELDDFLVLLPTDTLETWYQALSVLQAGVSAGRRAPANSAAPALDRASHSGGDADAAIRFRQERSGAAPPEDRIQRLLHIIAANAPGRVPRSGSDLISDVPDLLAAAAVSAAASPTEQLRKAIVTVAAWAGRIGAAGLTRPDDPAAEFPGRPDPAPPAGTWRVGAAGAHGPGHPVAEPLSGPGRTAAEPVGPQKASFGARAWTVSDMDVESVLPFLLLGPLTQVGYLSALVPALQAIGLEQETPAFATALSYTVLGPLGRGWRRQQNDVTTAAAFAGLGTPMPGSALTEFARAAAPALPALDAVVTRALAEGHTSGEPLVLAGIEDKVGGGMLLVDREGLFPVAWADTLDRLLPAWRLCGSPPVLVAPTAAGTLRELAAAGVSFVVANQPGPNERWRPLPPHRLWTNDLEDPAFARHAGGHEQAIQLTAELAQALAGDRAAVPLADGPILGRSLLLAAGLALGTLAWTLWREREPTDPLLALERFAGLSARLSFEPGRVRVRLPLGPRHSDLFQHGLLADVPGVPWFGGRVVEFSGG
jgi:hypothetical protein